MNKRKHIKKRNGNNLSTSNVQSNQLDIFNSAVEMFESKCQSISHFCCQSCHITGITIKPSKKNHLICTTCQSSHAKKEDMIKDLPIWFDKNGIAQFHLPDELKCLKEGEKLLIQQVAAYVPLLHLQDGQIGSRGHVCSFVQDISSVCTVLPRLPSDVQFVKIVKSTYKKVAKYQVKCLW